MLDTAKLSGPWAWFVCLLLAAVQGLQGQPVVSARPGLISHLEGRVILIDNRLGSRSDAVSLLHLEAGQHLRTEQGRAEVMLDPGTFLRLNEATEVEMVAASPSDIQLRLQEGSVLVEVRQKPESGVISVLSGDSSVAVDRKGLFRIDTPPDGTPLLRVFQGEFIVSAGGSSYKARSKESVALGGSTDVSKFDRSEKDGFDLWSRDRSDAIAKDERQRRQAAYQADCAASATACGELPSPVGYTPNTRPPPTNTPRRVP